MGIQCALCHSTVDDAFAPGIGHRLDGWPNRDLNVGAIVALAPDLTALTELLGVDKATVLKVLNSWGPGKYDAELLQDGKAFRPDGKSAATLLPPALGLAGVNLHTLYRVGFGYPLECLRGRYSDAREGDLHRLTIKQCNAISHCRKGQLRKRAK